ncbi:MAG: phosphoribosyltransferase family protein [Arhodomonas sp.]|nr:phosphoribosyltransferase family protein [Arhodomonas sp.]
MFRDRIDAAERLAERLSDLKGQQPLVLGIPRGGVPMAAHVADALDGELDVVLVHKIGAPGNPEYAIGAVGEDGQIDVSPPSAAWPGRTISVPRRNGSSTHYGSGAGAIPQCARPSIRRAG